MTTFRAALPVALHACGGGDRIAAERVLLRSAGVQTAYVNPATEMAYVEFDPALTSPQALFEVIKQAGFAPAGREEVRSVRRTSGGFQP